jgi:hypothetical protein
VAGDADRLARWLDRADLPIRLVPGNPALLAVGIGDRRAIRADGAMRLG